MAHQNAVPSDSTGTSAPPPVLVQVIPATSSAAPAVANSSGEILIAK